MTTNTEPTWSIVSVSKDGTAHLSRTGLAIDQAHAMIAMETKPGGPELFALPVPAEVDHEELGTFGLVYVIGNAAYIHSIGLTEETAKQLAIKVIEDHGPGAPRKPDVIRENANGSQTRMVDMTPVVRQAHAIDLAEVMQMVEFG